MGFRNNYSIELDRDKPMTVFMTVFMTVSIILFMTVFLMTVFMTVFMTEFINLRDTPSPGFLLGLDLGLWLVNGLVWGSAGFWD